MGDSAKHAVLSPSGASRWIVCTPSARLEQQFPDSSGAAAREGTMAHAIGELLLRLYTNEITVGAFEAMLDQIKAEDVESFYCQAMYEYADQYATFVMEQLAEARSHTSDAQLFIEKRLDLTDFVPDSFGTGDAGIIANTTLVCIDLKYGKGVEVSAENNKQMMLYALGWLKDFDFLYDIHEVQMTIFQPRIDNFSSWTIPVSELRRWAEDELKPQAALAFEGSGEFVTGKHCQFCRAKATCRALAEYNLELAKYDFRNEDLLTDKEVTDILGRIDMLVKWAGAVSDHALKEAAVNGKKWPGYKLVEGRSNRTFTSEETVADLLRKEKWPEDSIYNKKLKGITDMEKLLGGKKAFTNLLGAYVVKPPGKPALVPESDKRAEYAVSSAAADFAEEITD